jgi:hypothetical protein
MRRVRLGAAMVALVAALAFAGVALAQHFTKNGAPRCTDTGTELVCTGELAGLGNENLVVEVDTNAEATFLCGTPGNRKTAPGANKVPFEAGGSQTIEGGAIKNGRARFTVTAPSEPLPTPTPAEAGCPNNNWQVIGTQDVDFADINLTISQGGELLFTCTHSGPVAEGATVTLSCT